ncbi:hypothetical protein BCR43DRAFT_489134 [Syncephalastrum racemosum]|uniref:Uncharacterized protein n=1 Tax=Syncephalastrum racemosum TaxID=13706 RepID=A0A1X2HJW9_SYNRA|nr:hypothetical protein BCR43DRAFT_489134 [Syncephalastrum racemosum]
MLLLLLLLFVAEQALDRHGFPVVRRCWLHAPINKVMCVYYILFLFLFFFSFLIYLQQSK